MRFPGRKLPDLKLKFGRSAPPRCPRNSQRYGIVILSKRGPKTYFNFGGGEPKNLLLGRSIYGRNLGDTTLIWLAAVRQHLRRHSPRAAQ